MRPRLIAVDDLRILLLERRVMQASMRPRLIAVDDDERQARATADSTASMRPRLIAVDDRTGSCWPGSGAQLQ